MRVMARHPCRLRRSPGLALATAVVLSAPATGSDIAGPFREIAGEGELKLGVASVVSEFKELAELWPDAWPTAAAAAAGIDVRRSSAAGASPARTSRPLDTVATGVVGIREKSMLEQWLRSLQIEIPPIDQKTSSYELHLYGGSCGGLGLSSVDTEQVGDKLQIGASGLSAGCSLGLNFVKHVQPLPDISVAANISFNVTDSNIFGTLQIVTDGGRVPFLDAIVAPMEDCGGSFHISNLKLSGSVIADLVGLISGIVRRLLSRQLAPILCEQIDKAAQTAGQKALKNASTLAQQWLASPSHSPEPPSDLPDPHGDFVDLSKTPAVPFLSKLVEKVLNNASSPHNLNAIIAHYLGPGGNYSSGNSKLFPITGVLPVASLGEVGITVHSIGVGDLDTWSNLAFAAAGPHSIAGGLEIGELFANVTLTINVVPNCEPGNCPLSGENLTESFDFSTTLRQLGMNSSMFLGLNASHMSTLAVDQLASASCIAPGLVSPLWTGASFKLGFAQTDLKPLGAMAGDSLEADVDRMINYMLDDMLRTFAPTVSAMGDHALGVTGRDGANDKVSSVLATVLDQPCPPPAPTYSSDIVSDFCLVAAIAAFVAGLLAIPAGCLIARRQEEQKASRLEREAEMRFAPGADHDARIDDIRTTSHVSSVLDEDVDALPLALHSRVDLGTRICIPLLVVSAILLIVSSNSGIGAAVRLSITAGGEDVVVLPPVSGFSLISSVKDMWQGGVYPLAIIIALFSGVWPYAKLIMMLVCWFCPRSRMKLQNRQRFLHFLDAYGKWSMVDSFVMVIFMVAFRFELSGMGAINPMIASIFEEFGSDAKFIVYIEPTRNFYTFLIATIMSLCLSHGMTGCHRRALKQGEFGVSEIYNTPEVLTGGRRRLCNILRPSNYWDGKLFVYGPFTAVAVSLVMVVVGMFLKSMSFKFLGLSGYVLGEAGATRPYSIVSLGYGLPAASMAPNSLGIRWIQACYCVFAALTLPTFLALLLCLWAAPLSNYKHRQYLVACQTLNAWCGLDVFCVSIIASVLEIRQFALFMVGDRCDLINKILAQLPMSQDFDGAATCFDVKSELEPGLYILTIAAIIALVTGHITLARCSEALFSVEPRLLSSTTLVAEA